VRSGGARLRGGQRQAGRPPPSCYLEVLAQCALFPMWRQINPVTTKNISHNKSSHPITSQPHKTTNQIISYTVTLYNVPCKFVVSLCSIKHAVPHHTHPLTPYITSHHQTPYLTSHITKLHAILHHQTPCHTSYITKLHAILHHQTPCHTASPNTMPYCIIKHNAIQLHLASPHLAVHRICQTASGT
jgi:hypothetical protein